MLLQGAGFSFGGGGSADPPVSAIFIIAVFLTSPVILGSLWRVADAVLARRRGEDPGVAIWPGFAWCSAMVALLVVVYVLTT